MHGTYLNSKIFGFNHLHEPANSLDPKQTKLTFWIEVWKRCTFGERIHSGQFRVDRRQTEGYFKNFWIRVDGALSSGGSRWGAGGPPPPILRPIEFFLSPSPPATLPQDLDDRVGPPSVWRSGSAIVKVKHATKNLQLVLQHCWKTSWIMMLRVLPATKTNLATLFVARRVKTCWNERCCAFYHSHSSLSCKLQGLFLWVVKRVT